MIVVRSPTFTESSADLLESNARIRHHDNGTHVALHACMNPTSSMDDPGLDGPDYVALVIEWEEPTEVDRAAADKPVATRSGRLPALSVRTLFTAIAAFG